MVEKRGQWEEMADHSAIEGGLLAEKLDLSVETESLLAGKKLEMIQVRGFWLRGLTFKSRWVA